MNKNHAKDYTKKQINWFLEEVFELAFGDDAIYNGYCMEEVLGMLREFSDNALKWEEENE